MRIVIEIDAGELAGAACVPSAVTVNFLPVGGTAEAPAVPAAGPRVVVEVERAAPVSTAPALGAPEGAAAAPVPSPVRGVPAPTRVGIDAGPGPARRTAPQGAAPPLAAAGPTGAQPPFHDAGIASAPRALSAGAGRAAGAGMGAGAGLAAGPIPFIGAPAVSAALMTGGSGSAPVPDLPPDDLTVIRGIGPAIAGVLARAGITRYAQLAASRPDLLRRLLAGAQMAAGVESWPDQARLAADGDLEGLRALQAQLK
jgi:hypothetical protein